MSQSLYRLSFTTGGLLAREAAIVAQLYRGLNDWKKVRAMIESENLLQARTVSSAHRLVREVVQRLAELTDEEIDLVADATSVERSHLMWAAACRRYSLIGEFAEEVLRERFLVLATTLDHSDFDSFMRTKALWHEELDALKESTYRKLRSNIFLMMREMGIVDERWHLMPAVLSARVAAAMGARTTIDIRFFPTSARVTPEAGR
jgi:hypothetical protein